MRKLFWITFILISIIYFASLIPDSAWRQINIDFWAGTVFANFANAVIGVATMVGANPFWQAYGLPITLLFGFTLGILTYKVFIPKTQAKLHIGTKQVGREFQGQPEASISTSIPIQQKEVKPQKLEEEAKPSAS